MLPVLDELLNKEMDRRDFLVHVGMAVLALVGVTAVLKRLNNDTHTSTGGRTSTSAYGGANKSKS